MLKPPQTRVMTKTRIVFFSKSRCGQINANRTTVFHKACQVHNLILVWSFLFSASISNIICGLSTAIRFTFPQEGRKVQTKDQTWPLAGFDWSRLSHRATLGFLGEWDMQLAGVKKVRMLLWKQMNSQAAMLCHNSPRCYTLYWFEKKKKSPPKGVTLLGGMVLLEEA